MPNKYFSSFIILLVFGFNLTAQAPTWTVNPADYLNNMSITSQVHLDGSEVNSGANLLGAFVGSELRGVASPTDVGGKAYYFLTVYSNVVSGEDLTFQVYLESSDAVYPALEQIGFVKNSDVGNYPDGYGINVSLLNDFPIELSAIPIESTLAGYPFAEINLEEYLISQDNDPIAWSVSNGVHITGILTGSVLQATSVNPLWTGTECLEVTATETGTSEAYDASQTVCFTVEPDYGLPVFEGFPVQYVQEELPLPYGDFNDRLAFNGPCLGFSVQLLLPEGMEPTPAWQQPGGTSGPMTLTTEVKYGGRPVPGSSNLLAGFVGGQLAGVAGPQMVAGKELYYLSLANLDIGEITFQFYDAENGYLHEMASGLDFVPSGSAGTFSEPILSDFAPILVNLEPNGIWTTVVLDENWIGEQPVYFIAEDCSYSDKIDSAEVIFLVKQCITQKISLSANTGLCFQAEAEASEVSWYLNGTDGGESSYFAAFEPGVYHYEGLTPTACPNIKSCPLLVMADPGFTPPVAGPFTPPTNWAEPPNCGPFIFTDIMVDITPPVAFCKSATLVLDQTGYAPLSLNDVDDGSFTSCGAADISLSQQSFFCQHLGLNQVVLTIEDAAGRTGTCTASITVEDNMPPTALCKNHTVSLDANGSASFVPADLFLSGNDNCDLVTPISVVPATFNCNQLGPNNVTLTVEDGSSNSNNCMATVTVQDDTPPTVFCKNHSVSLDANGLASIVPNDVYLSGSDNCGTVNLISVSPSFFDCSNTGVNTVILTVDDGNGNIGNCSSMVTIVLVEDKIEPDAQCIDLPFNVTLYTNAQYTLDPVDIDNGSSDACGIQSLAVSPSIYTCASEGNHVVTLTVTDNNGNNSSCLATVTVAPFLTIDNVITTPESSPGLGDGTLTVEASAPNGQIGLSINGGNSFQFFAEFTNLAPGNYQVLVKVFGNSGICEKTVFANINCASPQDTWFKDSDLDGYHDGVAQLSCDSLSGYSRTALPGDCDDSDGSVYPGAPELCDGVDNDCSGNPEASVTMWNNTGDGLLWSDPANWSDGIVPLECQKVFIPGGQNVKVSSGYQAKGKTLEVGLGTGFTTEPTAVLCIEN